MINVSNEAFAAIEQFLDRRPYPIDKYTLVGSAMQDGAIPSVVHFVTLLPDRRYYSKRDVLDELRLQ